MGHRLGWVIGWAGLLGFSAVAAGAFAAHGLGDGKPKAWLQTGGEYGMIHAAAALGAALLARQGARRAEAAAWALAAGGTVFSASLYLMAFTGQLWLGAVTPVGGLAMLAGWGLLAWAGFSWTD